MTGERTIPILPCRDIDEILAFYAVLGFEQTYRQTRPNPYATVRRGGIDLHFFGIDGFEPASSYGSCIVAVPDADALYQAFVGGLRGAMGRIPRSGIPRVTRPRKKQDAVYGFSVVDVGGNWIRVAQQPSSTSHAVDEPPTGLAKLLETAVRLGDTKGDFPAAAKLLDTALERFADASPLERVPALVFRAELALAMEDPGTARAVLARIAGLDLGEADRSALDADLARARDVEAELGSGSDRHP